MKSSRPLNYGIFTENRSDMANKRTLKKQINAVISDVIDECIYIQETQKNKAQPAEKLIDEAVAFYNDLIARVHAGKNKVDFDSIWNDLNDKAEVFLENLNALSASKNEKGA